MYGEPSSLRGTRCGHGAEWGDYDAIQRRTHSPGFYTDGCDKGQPCMYRLGPRPPYRGCMVPIVHGLFISTGAFHAFHYRALQVRLSAVSYRDPQVPHEKTRGRDSRLPEAPKRRIRPLCPCAPAGPASYGETPERPGQTWRRQPIYGWRRGCAQSANLSSQGPPPLWHLPHHRAGDFHVAG